VKICKFSLFLKPVWVFPQTGVTAKCKKKKKRQFRFKKTEERNEGINPHSGTFGFSRHKINAMKNQKSLHSSTRPCPPTTPN